MKKIFIGSVATFLFFSPLLVFAADVGDNGLPIDMSTLPQGQAGTQSLPPGQAVTQPLPPGQAVTNPNPPNGGTNFALVNPLSVNTICGIIKKVLNAILALGIPVAMLFLVYAGFLFVKARGNPTELTHARENLFYVVIGIGIFLGAWLLGQIIANTINAINPGTVSGINSCN